MRNATRFSMRFGGAKTAALALVVTGALAIIGVDIAILSGAIYVSSKAAPAVSLAAAILIIVLCAVLLFASAYAFKEEYLLVTLAVFSDKIPYGDILYARQNALTKEVFLIVRTDARSQSSVRISVSPAKADDFIAALKSHARNLPVELFTEEK